MLTNIVHAQWYALESKFRKKVSCQERISCQWQGQKSICDDATVGWEHGNTDFAWSHGVIEHRHCFWGVQPWPQLTVLMYWCNRSHTEKKEEFLSDRRSPFSCLNPSTLVSDLGSYIKHYRLFDHRLWLLGAPCCFAPDSECLDSEVQNYPPHFEVTLFGVNIFTCSYYMFAHRLCWNKITNTGSVNSVSCLHSVFRLIETEW